MSRRMIAWFAPTDSCEPTSALGDTVWIEATQTSGVDLEIANGIQPQRFSLVWLSNS